MMFIDLHSHTTASDGSFTPKELVDLALKQGLTKLALTDHDTTAGLKEAREATKGTNLQIIAGVEISAKYRGGTLHILGLQVNDQDPELQKKLTLYQKARDHRNQKVISQLQAIGLDLSFEELFEFQSSQAGIGRPHIAKLLLKKGYVKTIDDAFKSYLGIGTPGFVPKEIFEASEAIGFIKDAGGHAVVAHPASLRLDQDRLRDYLAILKGFGLDGIEVYNSSHDPRQANLYQIIAKELDFLVSGGSDFHGSPKPDVKLGFWKPDQRLEASLVSHSLLES